MALARGGVLIELLRNLQSRVPIPADARRPDYAMYSTTRVCCYETPYHRDPQTTFGYCLQAGAAQRLMFRIAALGSLDFDSGSDFDPGRSGSGAPASVSSRRESHQTHLHLP